MTVPRQRGPECLDPETLAAFIDGRLDAGSRARHEAHISGCEDCYEALVETTKTLGVLAGDTRRGAKAPTSGRPSRWRYLGGLAAAAVVVLAISVAPGLIRRQQVDRAMRDLVAAVGTNRFTEARLSDDFAWGPRPGTVRAVAPADLPAQVLAATARLRSLTDGTDESEMLWARGVSSVVTGDMTEAIQQLERAVAMKPTNARFLTDLSAALLEQYKRDRVMVDVVAARTAAEAALLLRPGSPPALFNRALAVEALQGRDASRTAWEAYLSEDHSSGWADEARAHLARQEVSGQFSGQAVTPSAPKAPIRNGIPQPPDADALDKWGPNADITSYGASGMIISKQCSATLVGPKVVLTAAHCFPQPGIPHPVTFSLNKSRTNATCTRFTGFNSTTRSGDWALCRLDDDIQSVPSDPVALDARLSDETPVLVTGFGLTGITGVEIGDGFSIGPARVSSLPTSGSSRMETTGSQGLSGDSGGATYFVDEAKRRWIVAVNSAQATVNNLTTVTSSLTTGEALDFFSKWLCEKENRGLRISGMNFDTASCQVGR